MGQMFVLANPGFYKKTNGIVLVILFLGIIMACSGGGPTGSDPSDNNEPSEDSPSPEEYSAHFYDEKDTFVPGEIAHIVIEGGDLGNEFYEGEIGDENIELFNSDDTSEDGTILLMIVPPLSEDSHELSWKIGEQELELPFSIEEYKEIDNKQEYLSSFVDDLSQSLEGITQDLSSEDTQEWVDDLIDELYSSESNFSDIEDQQLSTLAYLVQTNLTFWSRIDRSKACGTSKDVIDDVAKNIEAGIVDITTVAGSSRLPGFDQESNYLAGVFGVTTYALGVSEAKTALGVALKKCINEPVNRLVFSGKFKQKITYKQLAEMQSFEFYHDQPERFFIESSFVPSEEVLTNIDHFLEVQAPLIDHLPEEYVDYFRYPPEDITTNRDPDDFSFGELSSSIVDHQTEIDGDEILLSFSYQQGEMPAEGQSFTFELTDEEHPESSTSIEAYLETDDIDIVTAFKESHAEVVPGELPVINVQGASLSKESYDGVIDGSEELKLAPLQGSSQDQLTFLVPELSEGTHTIEFRLAGRKQALEFTIGSYEPVSDPQQYTTDLTDQVDSELETLQQESDDQAVVDKIQEVRNDLENGMSDFESMTDREKEQLAYLLQRYLVYLNETNTKSALQKSGVDFEACSDLVAGIVGEQLLVRNALKVIIATSAVNILSGPVGAALVGAYGAAKFIQSARNVLENFDEALQECLVSPTRSLEEELNDQLNTSFAKTYQTTSSGSGLTFTHQEANTYYVQVTYSLMDEVKEAFNDFVSELDPVLEYLPSSWTGMLTDPEMELTEVEAPDRFSITNISDSRIEASTEAQGEQLSITFIYKEGQMPAEPQEFTFELHDSDYPDDPTSFSATLQPVNLPKVADQHITINKNETYNGELTGESTDDFEIVETVQYGELTLDDAQGGNFTYIPAQNLVTKEDNPDSFSYRGINDNGADTARVTIAVKDLSPVAYDDEFTVERNSYYEGTLRADNADKFVMVDSTEHGELDLNYINGDFRYTPNENYYGDDSFTFKAINEVGESNISNVRFTVNPELFTDEKWGDCLYKFELNNQNYEKPVSVECYDELDKTGKPLGPQTYWEFYTQYNNRYNIVVFRQKYFDEPGYAGKYWDREYELFYDFGDERKSLAYHYRINTDENDPENTNRLSKSGNLENASNISDPDDWSNSELLWEEFEYYEDGTEKRHYWIKCNDEFNYSELYEDGVKTSSGTVDTCTRSISDVMNIIPFEFNIASDSFLFDYWGTGNEN